MMLNRSGCLLAMLMPIVCVMNTRSQAEEGGGLGGPRKSVSQTIKIFQLQNVHPHEASNILGNVFAQRRGQSLTMAPDPRLNALIVRGEEETLAEIEALLLKMDVQPPKQEIPWKTLAIRLKNAVPSSIENAIREQASGTFTIFSDDRTGSLLVKAPADVLEKIQGVTEMLDAPSRSAVAAEEKDISIRMAWLVGEGIAGKDSQGIPSDLAPVIEALRNKTGIGKVQLVSQMIVHSSPGDSTEFTVLGTADLPTPHEVNFRGTVRRTATNRYAMLINAYARTLNDNKNVCEVNTQFQALAAGRPVVLGTTTVDSHPSVFVIQIMENNEK